MKQDNNRKSLQDWMDLLSPVSALFVCFATWFLVSRIVPELADKLFKGAPGIGFAALAVAFVGFGGYTAYKAAKRCEMFGLSE